MLGAIRRWGTARQERKLKKYADELGHMEPGELQHLRDQQSPVRGKWGFFPK